MKVLAILLTYGNRPKDILYSNILSAGYSAEYLEVCTEGIANALNEGIDLMTDHFAVAFVSNDIREPQGWLAKKMEALLTYPDAGIVASSLDYPRTEQRSELIISNWLLSKSTINRIGYFNESMFPYGPIDLDYCERCHATGIKTYYVLNCLAKHEGTHATGNEYGWDKTQLVQKYDPDHQKAVGEYKSGQRKVYLERHGKG